MSAPSTWVRVTVVGALLAGCANRFEARGDRALAAGDEKGALAHYEAGLAERPIMDYEYAALRAKRAQLLTSAWAPRIDEARRLPTATASAAALVTLWEEAVAQRVTVRIRDEVTQTLTAAIARLEEAPGTVDELLALLDRVKASPRLWIATADAIGGAAALGLPGLAARSDLDALAILLELREALRARGVPASSDAKLDGGFAALASRPSPVVSAAEAPAVAERALALHARAAKLGAPAAARAVADRAFEAAVPHLLAATEQLVAAHRYVPALAVLGPLAARADGASAVRTRYRAIAAAGAAWHASEAAALPAGYRQLVHLDAARSLGAAASAATAARAALRSDWETALAIAPAAGGVDGCGALWPRVAGAFGTAGKPLPATIQLACTASETTSREPRTIEYDHEVEYVVEEPVVVGTRREQVQVGTHDEQCSKESSLEGHSWVGVCKVPDYEWRTIEITELRPVRKTKDEHATVRYEAITRTITARVTGTARVVWDDGTALSIPIDVEARAASTAFEVSYPARKLGEAPRREQQVDDASLTPASVLAGLAGQVTSAAGTGAHAQVRAHRARLARADGVAATARGDAAAAGEAFARSAMLGDDVQAEAAAWFEREHGLDAATAYALLHAPSARFGEPPPRAAITADAYAPPAVELPAEAQGPPGDLVFERDVAAEGTEGDEGERSILSPVERLGAWIAFAPYSIQSRTMTEQRTYAAMLELNSSPIGKGLGLRYGPTIHDDLVTRILVGVGAGGDYDTGASEGRFGWGWGAAYHAMLGYRTHHVAVFAGAGGGYAYFRGGDDKTRGAFAEPAARITLRPWGVGIIAIDATGFVSFGDLARRDAIAVSLPLSRYKTGQFRLSFEQIELPTEVRELDGMTRTDLGRQPVRVYALSAGGRF